MQVLPERSLPSEIALSQMTPREAAGIYMIFPHSENSIAPAIGSTTTMDFAEFAANLLYDCGIKFVICNSCSNSSNIVEPYKRLPHVFSVARERFKRL